MLDTILLIVFGLLGLSALSLFVNAVFGNKFFKNFTGIIFDVSKYLLIALLITLSIKYESVIGVIIFIIVGIGVVYLGRKRK